MTLEEMKAAVTHHVLAAQALAAKADDENRDFTGEERAEVSDHMAKAKNAKDAYDAALKRANDGRALRDELAALGNLVPDNAKQSFGDYKGQNVIRPSARKSLGEQYVEGDSFAKLRADAGPSGYAKSARIHSDRTEFKTLITGGSDTSAGAGIVNDAQGLLVGLGAFQRPLTITDLVTTTTTSSDTVEYVQVTSTTNNASPVAESTTTATPGTQNAANGVKPESALALAKQTANVRTIAHWIPATTRALSDAGQIRALIDAFLMYGLEEELEDQILSGNGAGENFDGITHVSGTQAQAYDTDLLTTTRKARTKVKTVGRSNATAYVLHPNDWQTIDLLQDNEARYFFGGPARPGNPVLWGLPVVESEGVTEGTGVVGDFRKAFLWDREQASIQVSNQHADFFIRNMVAILAELRAAFGVIQPNAFVIIDLTA